jgi:hypothetical protein
MGEPFSELKGAGKGSVESKGLRAERKRRERNIVEVRERNSGRFFARSFR